MGRLSTGQVERVAVGLLQNWCARANVDLAEVTRNDSPVDFAAAAADLKWISLVQVKGVSAGGLTVWAKYLGLPVVIVFVFLGKADGGSVDDTFMIVLSPEEAWALPPALGLSSNPKTDISYRWPRTTKSLLQAVEASTARTPQELAALLEQYATHVPAGFATMQSPENRNRRERGTDVSS